MSFPFSVPALIHTSHVDGPTLTAAAEALLVTDVNIQAGFMRPGRILLAKIAGKASNAVTTPGTLTLRARWGGLAGTQLATSGALTQNVIVQTDKTFTLEWRIQCRTIGSSGTFLTWGLAQRGNCAAAAVADITPDVIPANSMATVSVDTTIDKLLSFTAEPSLGTASITALTYDLYVVG